MQWAAQALVVPRFSQSAKTFCCAAGVDFAFASSWLTRSDQVAAGLIDIGSDRRGYPS